MNWPREEPRLREAWSLDPAVAFLNHGSFGACPSEALAKQVEWQRRMERQLVQFFLRDLPPLLDAARAELAHFVSARPDDLAFVPNVTV
ncbi:MAG: aminotransferase, partial [Deltaproteobacteria bacterium]|nr:aminotransferase [Deltaproteobacteria bacterium]